MPGRGRGGVWKRAADPGDSASAGRPRCQRVLSRSPPCSASRHVDRIVLSGRFLQGLNSPPEKRWGSPVGCQHPSQSFFLPSDGARQPRASSLTPPEVKAARAEALPTQRNVTNLPTREASPARKGAADGPPKPRAGARRAHTRTENENLQRASLVGGSQNLMQNFSRNTADLEKELGGWSTLENDRRRLVKKTPLGHARSSNFHVSPEPDGSYWEREAEEGEKLNHGRRSTWG